jgi:membrane-associated phospholipid phosphatase
LIAVALLAAVVAGLLPGAFVYVLAVLPGLVAYLAFRTLLASTFVSLLPMYFVIGDLTRNWTMHAPEVALDRLISVQPGWTLVYASLYVFIVPLPLLVVRQRDLFRRALQAYLGVMLVSYAGFVLYPTVAPRPSGGLGDGFAAWSLQLIYALDQPYGCFPSLHVAYSFVSALTCHRVHRGVGLAATVWAALIGVSTLYTKQHYVVDVAGGVAAALAAYALFLRPYPREAVDEIDRLRAPARSLAVVGIFLLMVGGFWMAYRLQ